ncbi:MAG: hypothetical protein J6L81_10805 [Clostridia bacterium]|nr:hypothetical protein [Clostridia bacterium]
MNRYKEANDRLVVPKELTDKLAEAKTDKRYVWIVSMAAVLILFFTLTGVIFSMKDGDDYMNEKLADAQNMNTTQNTGALPTILAPEAVQTSQYALIKAVYPQMSPYPDHLKYTDESTGMFDGEGFEAAYDAWKDDRRAQASQLEGYDQGLEGFYEKTARQFLTGAQSDNLIYSPLNVYMALAMLAETTDGESRAQILELLGAEDIGQLRMQAKALWNANYSNDGLNQSVLASSLWLNEDIEFNEDTIKTIADNYYSSAYQGVMGSSELDEALRTWLNEQTGGLLKDEVAGVELDRESVLAMATTVYFQARWSAEFNKNNNTQNVFRAPDGDINCTFMNQSLARDYYWGDSFSAVCQNFTESGEMWLILPDEGTSVDELLANDSVFDLLDKQDNWEDKKFLTVNLSVPKFDASSKIDLSDGLKKMGVTDVFDDTRSDFSPLTSQVDGVYLSKVDHAARVTIDEEGCTAAAYTVMALCGAAMPPQEEVDFVLDRPFVFAITGQGDSLMFMGVVNKAE